MASANKCCGGLEIALAGRVGVRVVVGGGSFWGAPPPPTYMYMYMPPPSGGGRAGGVQDPLPHLPKPPTPTLGWSALGKFRERSCEPLTVSLSHTLLALNIVWPCQASQFLFMF